MAVHRLPMLIRPSRVASARRTPAPDAAAPQACKLRKRKISEEEEHVAVVTTEFNYQYRVGDGSFIVCKEKEDGGTYETPVLFVSMVSPKGAPDITEIGALYLYNTDYLTRNLQDYNNLLPAEVVGKNCWVLANRPVNFSSARPSSAWMATPARACNGEVRARPTAAQPRVPPMAMLTRMLVLRALRCARSRWPATGPSSTPPTTHSAKTPTATRKSTSSS